MWASTVKGQLLHFHLAGINNQNFIMRDEETGSWWQQVSGEAIQGALQGEKLDPVYFEESTFDVWKREHPNGRVLRPDEKVLQAGNYESADWEQQVGKMPIRISGQLDKTFEPRALVVGVNIDGQTKAYPVTALEKQSPIIDQLGGKQIIIVLGTDKKSVRAFDTEIDGQNLEFFVKTGAADLQMIDAQSGSLWDFSGAAMSGKLAGKQLKKIAVLKDYWFDWKTYNPATKIYSLGNR